MASRASKMPVRMASGFPSLMTISLKGIFQFFEAIRGPDHTDDAFADSNAEIGDPDDVVLFQERIDLFLFLGIGHNPTSLLL